MTTNFTDS